MRCGDIAQSRAPCHIRTIGKGLIGYFGPLTPEFHPSSRDGIRSVLLPPMIFDHNTAAKHRAVGGIRLLRVCWMYRMGIVRRDQKAVRHQLPVHGRSIAQAALYPQQNIFQKCGIRALSGPAAHLLIVKHRQYIGVLPGYARHKTFQPRIYTLQIIQPGAENKFPLPAQ